MHVKKPLCFARKEFYMRQNTLFFNSLYYMRDNIDTMTKTERIIASYILKNPASIVSDTLKIIAKKMSVSEGSIINFSKMIGFSGFSEMKLNIAQCITPVTSFDKKNELSPASGGKEIMKQILDNVTASFRTTYDLADENRLNEAATMLLAAKNIEIYGLTSSAALASDTAYRLMKLGLPVKAETDPLVCPVSALMLNRDSVIIAISASGRTHDLIRAINIAKEQGAQIISITSSASSPVAKLSSLAFITGTSHVAVDTISTVDNLSNETKIVQLFLIESLCAYIAAIRKDESIMYQKKIDNIWKEYYSR